MPENLDQLTFEEAMERLESLLAKVEDGEQTLAELVTDYELGSSLLKHCKTLLGEAELKIQRLNEGDGTVLPMEEVDDRK